MKNVELHELNRKNTQEKFTWAITYIAYGESGRGLDPKKFEAAMQMCREWKRNMVQWLIGKPVFGKPGQFHTEVSAVETADNLFKKRYAEEVRAHQSEPIQNYWTRQELSNIEYGRNLFEDGSRLDEVQTPIYDLRRAWTSKLQQKRNVGYFLSMLAKGKPAGRIVRNAYFMAKNYAISWKQFNHLREVAGDITVTAARAQVDQTELPV